MLTVIVVTYNHLPFIAKAIDSILMQNVNFVYRIIIADDYSNDGTTEICKQYQKAHPSLISILPRSRNIGIHENLIDALSNVDTEFVAFLEGDDYWLSDFKLQKQVDFLRENNEYVAVYHNSQVVDKLGQYLKLVYAPKKKNWISFIDLLKGDYLKTCTVVFRFDIDILVPFIKNEMNFIDVNFFLKVLEPDGKAYYMSDVMSAYRIHDGGVYSSRVQEINVLENIKNRESQAFYYRNTLFYKILLRTLNTNYLELALIYLEKLEFKSFIHFYFKVILNLKYGVHTYRLFIKPFLLFPKIILRKK